MMRLCLLISILAGGLAPRAGRPAADTTPTASAPAIRMGWYGSIAGDTHVVCRGAERGSAIALDSIPFEPVLSGEPTAADTENNVPKPPPEQTSKVLLLLCRQSTDSRPVSLRVIVTKSIPRCTECDSYCFTLSHQTVDTLALPMPAAFDSPGGTVLDLTDRIATEWEFMGFSAVAQIIVDGEVVSEASVRKEGWSWCM